MGIMRLIDNCENMGHILCGGNYGTFHKKLNDVGWSSGGQHPTVNGQSAVSQQSVSGRSPGQVNVNTYVIIIK